MRQQPTPKVPDERVDQAIFDLLLDPDEQRPFSQRELELEVGSHVEVEDSLARLRVAGLTHRSGEFVWASRAALHAERLRL